MPGDKNGCWLDHVSPAGLPGVIHVVVEVFSAARAGKPRSASTFQASACMCLPVYHYPMQVTEVEGNVIYWGAFTAALSHIY